MVVHHRTVFAMVAGSVAALCKDFGRIGTNLKTPEHWQPAILCGCSFEWYKAHHEKPFACFLMNEMRSHDGSGDIEFTLTTVLDEIGVITMACFSNHVGWDLAQNTAGYAIRGRLTRATS